jgi:hypothetical protein
MIINSSNNLYNASDAYRRTASFTGETIIFADGHGIAAGASVFRGETMITAHGNTRLPLAFPEPILNEIATGAFDKQYYSARLLDNLGNPIAFSSASIEAPLDAIGKRVSVNVAKKDLSLITNEKTYTFQIGTRETPTGAITWETIIENGKLNSRSFALGQNGNLPADSLSFGTIEPLKNRLNKYPLANIIFYNSRKTSVQITAGELIRDTTGAAVDNETIAINYMTLYDLLEQLRKRVGFSQIVTNIPNFELTRADFPITSSYLQSLASIVGIFEPIFYNVGTILYILDKTAAIPDEFEPVGLTVDDFSGWSISIPESQELDGFLVSYSNDETNANFFTTRLVQTTQESGSFGSPDYTRIDTETTFKEWHSFDAPDEVLRSEIISVKKESFVELLTLVSRRTETHEFDSAGKRISSSITNEGLVPDLSADGVPSFQTVREEAQTVSYTTDAKNPRRSIQSQLVTNIRGIIAIDADNTYYDPDTGDQAPFKQDFLEAHKAGNLKDGMTTGYGPLKTITETLLDLGNGQYQMSVSTIDHLRKAETASFSEPKTGDASFDSSRGKQSHIIVLKDGLTLSTRPGNAIESVSIGELPLYFGIPLVQRKLARRIAQKQSGSVNVIGYSSSIERGVIFRVYDRAGASYGKFIAKGYRVDIAPMGDGAAIQTTIEVDQI